MDVLEQDDRRGAAERGEDGGEQVVARQGDVDLELRRDLDDRAEWARGGDAVARAGDHPYGRAVGGAGEEGRDQGRLPGAGLTADQDECAVAGAHVLEMFGQRGQLRAPFDEVHDRKVGAAPSRVNGRGPR